MAKQVLTAAFWDYDRTRPLADGRVAMSGHDLQVTFSAPEATFERAADAEFDISELSFSNSVTRLSRGQLPYVLIPVFLSRAFRHSTIFIRTDRGIDAPADLRGKSLGVQEYDMTAAVVVRGLLRDQFGVLPEEIRWCVGETGGGTVRKFPGPRAAGLSIEPLAPGSSLEERLVGGELDAIIVLRPSQRLFSGYAGIRRLFPDPKFVEEQWFTQTRHFPIMHVVGIRRELCQQEPDLALEVFEAFAAAKEIALREIETLQAPKITLPWPHLALAEVRALMGEDFWPYGVRANRHALETQLRWSWLDGLQERRVGLLELFPPAFDDL
jgi:4,5-dihydroxyphthalate decarboxylase